MPLTTSPSPLRVTAPCRSIGADLHCGHVAEQYRHAGLRLEHYPLEVGHPGRPARRHGPCTRSARSRGTRRRRTGCPGPRRVARRPGRARTARAGRDRPPRGTAVRPPHELTSLTPGTERRRVRRSQSWMVLALHRVDAGARDQYLVDLAEGNGHGPRTGPAPRVCRRAPRPSARSPADARGRSAPRHRTPPSRATGPTSTPTAPPGRRHAHQRRLDRIRAALLHLWRRQPRRLGDHHHLVVGQIRERLYRQVAVGQPRR